MAEPRSDVLPVIIAGGGPIGLITALGLVHHGVPCVILEEDSALSLDTKAGTVLTRTLEVLARYNALDPVLRASVRIDEIGETDRSSDVPQKSILTANLADETQFPFVINIPQHHLEPVLHDRLDALAPGTVRMRHRVTGFEQHTDGVTVAFDSPDGPGTIEGSYLLGCDGGRSFVREQLGARVDGMTLEERYMLIDLEADLDVSSPRDYPYLSYFGDSTEWMILVRQPHCWRFLFPLAAGAAEPTPAELQQKVLRFIGDVDSRVIGTNIYSVHHRVASQWQSDRVFLMGDAAHLITPMWALGLNTGVLDASNLPWRLSWVLRGWADPELLAGYEAEQSPIALRGSGEIAEAARKRMGRAGDAADVINNDNAWAAAMTRTLLGVVLDVDGSGRGGIIVNREADAPLELGQRVPDAPVFGPAGRHTLHELCADSFVALYFTDARRQPPIPGDDETPGLRHRIVSRWDAPENTGLRPQSLFDPGERATRTLGVPENTLVLLRPDGHVAAIEPWDPRDPSHHARGAQAYRRITRPSERITHG
ncbi:FAD-dependent monooxygenase [Leucobacter albus]|uniref:FAD-dependent monooxygenase n=1 Tax=Leucobacter albus TaxID=272210 RepID=A0ABW3TPZ8_9MICO